MSGELGFQFQRAIGCRILLSFHGGTLNLRRLSQKGLKSDFRMSCGGMLQFSKPRGELHIFQQSAKSGLSPMLRGLWIDCPIGFPANPLRISNIGLSDCFVALFGQDRHCYRTAICCVGWASIKVEFRVSRAVVTFSALIIKRYLVTKTYQMSSPQLRFWRQRAR